MDSGHILIYDEEGNFSSSFRLQNYSANNTIQVVEPLAVIPPENAEDSVRLEKEQHELKMARERKRKASEPEQETSVEHRKDKGGKRTAGQERKKGAQQYSATARCVGTRKSLRLQIAGNKNNGAEEVTGDEEDASIQAEDSSDGNYEEIEEIEEDIEDDEDASSQQEDSSDEDSEKNEEDNHSLKVST